MLRCAHRPTLGEIFRWRATQMFSKLMFNQVKRTLLR
jgi:hypothetical protein